MQARYAEATSVKGLKIRHNNVLGYFVEVTRSMATADDAALNATFIPPPDIGGTGPPLRRPNSARSKAKIAMPATARRAGAGNF